VQQIIAIQKQQSCIASVEIDLGNEKLRNFPNHVAGRNISAAGIKLIESFSLAIATPGPDKR